MQSLRQALIGLATGALSTALVVGVLFVVLAEGNMTNGTPPEVIVPPAVDTPVEPVAILPTMAFATPSFNQTPSAATAVVVPSALFSPTFLPAATQCPPPMGWVPVNVAPGDSIETISARFLTNAEIVRKVNCLSSDSLVTGSVLYVPYVPLPSATACRPPASWIRYTVQSGDTLYRISILYRVSVDVLQRGNCMGHQTLITAGETLHVPNVPPSTLTFTPVTPATEIPPTETPGPADTTEPSPSDTPAPTEPLPGPTETPTSAATP